MKISIVIPTYNGAHKILGLLSSLESQSMKPDEVIVIIDGSTDGTKDLLRNHFFSFNEFRVIEQENGGRSKVRNRGAKEAIGDLLIFFDDDMIPEPHCVAVHIKHHEKYDKSILTGAQIDSARNSDIQNYKASLSVKWSIPLQKIQDRPLHKENIFITAANFSISKILFIQLQGFDEQLTDAEDFDMAVRAFQQGVPIYYDHAAFAFHNDSVTGKSYIKRLREYSKAGQRIRELKPNLKVLYPAHEPILPIGVKRIIFMFFTSRFWVNWLDKFFLKNLVPRFVRYKLYDLIITANGVYFPEKVEL
jgi:GT2 family glycosyltransferase